jgi:hypothetical protein
VFFLRQIKKKNIKEEEGLGWWVGGPWGTVCRLHIGAAVDFEKLKYFNFFYVLLLERQKNF